MPLYDYQCYDCQSIEERIESIDIEEIQCRHCLGTARRIITMRRAHGWKLTDPDWIQSVLDVVEKDSGKPHCEEFIKHPTRENYHKWMKGENLRPFEPGESTKAPSRDPDFSSMESVNKEVYRRHRQRMALEVKGS